MLKKITSFGYKHLLPPLQLSDSVVVDIRRMFDNPHREPALRNLTGLDRSVQEFVESTPNFDGLYHHLKQRVSAPGIEQAFIGCTGGKHRSVFLAQKIADELGIEVEHRDIRE